MKQCPVCQTTYTDDSLQFCLADGATLSFPATEQPTQVIPPSNNPIRVNIAQDTSPTVVAQPTVQPTIQPVSEKKGSGIIIGLLVTVLALVVLGSAGTIGWLLLRDRGGSDVVSNKTPIASPSVNPTATQTPNDAANLRSELENLKKQIQDQKNQKGNVPTISNTTTPQTTSVTARANSPNDGFLALRTGPSSETGERIMKIPHGAVITVLGCLPRAAGKNGRWCRVNYNGNVGWAFDGYMIYE
jgi:hypothetical protein